MFVEKLIVFNNVIKCPSLCTLHAAERQGCLTYLWLSRIIMKFRFCKQSLTEIWLWATWKYFTSTSLHRNCHFCLAAFTMCQMRPISSSPVRPSLPLPLSSPALSFSFFITNTQASPSVLWPWGCADCQSRVKRNREKVKERKRKEQWGEKEREGWGCSVSPFSVAARNRKMTQIRRVCFMSWEQRARGTRLITFPQYFCFRILLSIFFTTRNNVGHLLLSSFSFPPLFSPLLFRTFLPFYFVVHP